MLVVVRWVMRLCKKASNNESCQKGVWKCPWLNDTDRKQTNKQINPSFESKIQEFWIRHTDFDRLLSIRKEASCIYWIYKFKPQRNNSAGNIYLMIQHYQKSICVCVCVYIYPHLSSSILTVDREDILILRCWAEDEAERENEKK